MDFMTTTAVYHNIEMDDYTGKSLRIVYLVMYSLVLVLGVLGNGVVIWVTGFKMKKTVSTVWYLNLAVADFLVAVLLPLGITYTALDRHWPFGNFMCKMSGIVFFMNMYASIYTLVVISVDRCVGVVCPVWAQNHRSVRKASFVCLGVWVLALALSSPYFIYRDTQPAYHDKVRCYNDFEPTGNYSATEVNELVKFRSGAMIITRFFMGLVVPFTVIASCYSVIIYRLRIHRSLVGQSVRPFKIIATVITTFFLCWAPYHIMHLIKYSETRVVYFGIPITTGLALLNSCLNPLLYVFMGQGFKDVFRRSILKVLEKAFAEELPRTNIFASQGSTREETGGLFIL